MWRENSARDLKTELCTTARNRVVVRSSGAGQVFRLSVDHRNFYANCFLCTTEQSSEF